jgi:hypothetical protein
MSTDTALDAVLHDIDTALATSTNHPGTAARTARPAPPATPAPDRCEAVLDDIDAVLEPKGAASTRTGSIAEMEPSRVIEIAQIGMHGVGAAIAHEVLNGKASEASRAAGLSGVQSTSGAVATVPELPPMPPAVAAVRDAIAAERHQQIQPAQPGADPSEEQAKGGKQEKRDAKDAGDLDDGVLPKAGKLMGVLQGAVGMATAAEAAFNIFKGAHVLLQLPLYMALLAPMLFEAAASSFAIQDLQDRRRGVESTMMSRSAWAGIGLSAVVGGLVGFFLYGPFGVLAAAASIVFGAMLHVHGDRAIRAHQSRMKQSDAWKHAQQRAAETTSARDVLTLLLPRDADGRATADLLHKRMDAATLTPGDALIAAGWHRRTDRGLSESQMIRLETVAATVWGKEGLPAPPAPPALPGRAASRRSSRHSAAPGSTQAGASGSAPTQAATARGASPTGGSTQATQGGSEVTQRRQLDDAALTEWVHLHLMTHPEDGERPIARALNQAGYSGSAKRIREALRAIKIQQDTPQDTPQSTPDPVAVPALATEGGDRR